MDNDTKKIIDDQLNSLPQVLRDTILKSGWERKVHEMAKKHQLHVDQEGDLVNETFLVLLGLELAKDFESNLTGNLHVDKATATDLVAQIGTEIFAPIREHLQNIEASDEEGENEDVVEPTESLNKADILKEIEDPTPVTHPSTAIEIPQTKEISAKVISATESIVKMPEAPKPNIIEQKLTSVTYQPAEKVEAPVKKPAIDPYREPIN